MKKILFILVAVGLFAASCGKDNPKNQTAPEVTTADVTNVQHQTATGGGEVTSDGNADVTARGVVWSNSPGPDLATGNLTVDGSGIGVFTSNITGLGPNTQYYIRAYAINAVDTAYGEEKTFTTPI